MKAVLKIILVFVVSCVWYIILDRPNAPSSPLAHICLPDWLAIIIAIGLSLGLPYAAYMAILCRSWRLRRLPAIWRWIVYLSASLVLTVGTVIGTDAIRFTLNWNSPWRVPGPQDFSEEDVRKFVTPGRPLTEITNRFGLPHVVRTNGDYVISEFNSKLPETRPRHWTFSGFCLWTKDGKTVKWRISSWERIGKPYFWENDSKSP